MVSLDLRWALHHPIRWLRAVWFHWAVAALLLVKAMLVTDPLWQVTLWASWWPVLLGLTAGMCLASSVAPGDSRLQNVTMLTLLGVAVWRAVTYLLVALAVGPDEHNTIVLAQAFALHWGIIAAVATRWPIISTKAALLVTVEAGRESGHLRATA